MQDSLSMPKNNLLLKSNKSSDGSITHAKLSEDPHWPKPSELGNGHGVYGYPLNPPPALKAQNNL